MSESTHINSLILFIILNASIKFVFCVSFGLKYYDLGGSDWFLSGPPNYKNLTTTVPGEVHVTLLNKNLITDPLFRFNDLQYRWVALNNWNFSKKFKVSEDDMKHQKIDLVCEGIDTIADILINDFRVGSVENMFRKYVFNIKPFLKASVENSLSINFISPITYAKDRAFSYPYLVPPICPPSIQHGECSYNFIRKAAYSFSWDWGPSFPSIGIWKDIYLKMYDIAHIEYVTSETNLVQDKWILKISSFLKVSENSFGKSLKLSIVLPELNVTKVEMVPLKSLHLQHDTLLTLNESNIKLWWPYGMGHQPLYNVLVVLENPVLNRIKTGKIDDYVDSHIIKVGFRTVDLVQNFVEIDGGLTFYFSINNRPIFLKGSNWIPVSNFLTNQTKEQYDWLLLSTIHANMNVLRVWGGGVYETDYFYQRADELGIMIWQDFMFACAMYPVDGGFLEDVEQEVIHQVRRLKHHASIIIWSGNNENEGALANNWYNIEPDDIPLYKSDYIKLYVGLMREVVMQEDMSRPFIPSSPTNGLQTMLEGWVAENPQDIRFGDIHFYNYKMNAWHSSAYLKPRMASEFGFQSWPSTESLQQISIPSEDWKLFGQFPLHRQHHLNGEMEIFTEINQHFNFNTTYINETKQFMDYVYLSQINQAMSIKSQVEHYRRNGCNLKVNLDSSVTCNDGGTMGAMYWQLNDVWQAPTWSSIEPNGKWKILHYYAVKFFKNQLVSPFINGSSFEDDDVDDDNNNDGYGDVDDNDYGDDDDILFYTIFDDIHSPDTRVMMSNLSLIIKCYHIERFGNSMVDYLVPFNQKTSNKIAYHMKLKILLENGNCPTKEHCFLFVQLISNFNSIILSENFLLLSSYINSSLIPRTYVKINDVSLKKDQSALIQLEVDNYGFFIYMEAIGLKGKFSDNGFIMKERFKNVSFTFHSKPDIKTLKRSLKISSLSDVYT